MQKILHTVQDNIAQLALCILRFCICLFNHQQTANIWKNASSLNIWIYFFLVTIPWTIRYNNYLHSLTFTRYYKWLGEYVKYRWLADHISFYINNQNTHRFGPLVCPRTLYIRGGMAVCKETTETNSYWVYKAQRNSKTQENIFNNLIKRIKIKEPLNP